MSTDLIVTVVVSAVVVPAVSFRLAVVLARRQQRYSSRADLYARLLVAFRKQLEIAKWTYPNENSERLLGPTPGESDSLNAEARLHASAEVRVLLAEFNLATGDVHRLSMAMEGLANARQAGNHPDVERSLEEEWRYHPYHQRSITWAEQALGRLAEEMARELHGRGLRPSRRARKMHRESEARAKATMLPRVGPLQLPQLPDEPAKQANSS